ncbi:MAG: hypothetical protein IKG82_09240 [Oscillospiraceae bacterium]|nr:hypothetical protein [Oscillospiraceae bacterium]
MEELTGEIVLRQIRKSYTPALICAGCLFLCTGICTAVCALRYGFFTPATIVCAALAFAALILLLISLFRWIFVTKSRVLQPFGNAIAMAGCIRAGGTFAIWQTPPYRKYPLIITEEYLVCPARVESWLQLSEISSAQRYVLNGAGFLRCLLKAHSLFAARAALSVTHKDRAYHKRHPLPDTELFDLLVLRDQKKKRHNYFVSVADFHDVLAFIREYQPDAVFRPDKTI